MTTDEKKICNVAIIAHVDHGKTTVVDAILKQSHVFRDNEEEMNIEQILDSNDLEREKGITIMAKNIAINYKDYKINIIDTPGHADFGGEVERTLNMASVCILVVDAQEGPMIQTRVVLRKALELGLKPIVVINKIDKKLANIPATLDKIQNLFLELASDESQLDFPILYAVARAGKVFEKLPEGNLENADQFPGNVTPLLDTIIKIYPDIVYDKEGALQMQISSLEYDQHSGRYLIGRINRGTALPGKSVVIVSEKETRKGGRIKSVLVREGLKYIEVECAKAGEIVAITGIESTDIGYTLCDVQKPDPLPNLEISPPSIEVKFEPNTSPFVGRDGEFVTSRLLKRRLEKENDVNVGIDIITDKDESNSVFVRGELQLSILIENLRREGYEFQIRKPSIVMKEENGIKMEPIEELAIEVPEEFSSLIVQELSFRNAELVDMQNRDGKVYFEYKIKTREILGLRNYLNLQTKGKLVFNSSFEKYVPFSETQAKEKKGKLISNEKGVTAGYALNTIQERGDLFVSPSEEVYEGMIIGINKFDQDMEVNPTKERKKSGVRVSHAIITLTDLKPPIRLTLEQAVEMLEDDEVLEITPKFFRLRKRYLTRTEREWAKRDNLTPLAKSKLGNLR